MGVRALGVCFAIAAAFSAAGAAADGAPGPGIVQNGAGITSPDGSIRYLALNTASGTVLEAISVRGGALLNYVTLRGQLGIPSVTVTGTPAGLTRDGKTLVLSTYPGSVARFTFVRTGALTVERTVRLRGTWTYDALSPGGRILYLIQYARSSGLQRYSVRAYDLAARRLIPGSIVDKSESGPMSGSPMIRVTRPDGSWAYTLYVRQNGTGFIHALDTEHRFAVCVDLPWKNMSTSMSDARLALSRDGTKLVLHTYGANGPAAVVDTRTFRVKMSKPS
jgi:hypothetical protein